MTSTVELEAPALVVAYSYPIGLVELGYRAAISTGVGP